MLACANDASQLLGAFAFGMAKKVAPQALQHPGSNLEGFYPKSKWAYANMACVFETGSPLVSFHLEEEAVEGFPNGGFPHPEELHHLKAELYELSGMILVIVLSAHSLANELACISEGEGAWRLGQLPSVLAGQSWSTEVEAPVLANPST